MSIVPTLLTRGRRIGRHLASKSGRKVASVTSLSLAVGSLVVLAALSNGSPVTDVDLNDGSVWVTNGSTQQVGRVNTQVQELDQGVVSEIAQVDVLQHASDVYMSATAGDANLRSIDVAKSTAGAPVDFGRSMQSTMGGTTVAVVDPSRGNAWVRGRDTVQGLSVKSAVPDMKLGTGGMVTVSPDGVAYGLAPTKGEVQSAKVGASGAAEAGGSQDIDVSPSDDLQLSVAGDHPLVLDPDRGTLAWPGHDPVRMAGLKDAELQSPATDGAYAYVARTDGLSRVDLSSGNVSSVGPGDVDGQPARPVVKDGCTHAAWADPSSNRAYWRGCDDGTEFTHAIPEVASSSDLVFRVNRHVVVLNDVIGGNVWLVQTKALKLVNNWDAINPSKDPRPTKQTKIKKVRRTDENHPPTANPDDLGARPGLPTVLPLTNNDTDPDGDILVITKVRQTGGPKPSVAPAVVGRGTQLQVSFPKSASGARATFSYSIGDGRKLPDGSQGTATSTATVNVKPTGTNEPPKLLQGREDMHFTVARGASASYYVNQNWIDPDGDDLVLAKASIKSGAKVQFRADGVITFQDDGRQTGTKQIDVVLSDGHDGGATDGVVDVDVSGAKSLPPELIPDTAEGVSGSPVRIEPLTNDQSPDGTALGLVSVSPVTGVAVVPDPITGAFTATADKPGTYYLNYKAGTTDGQPATSFVRLDVLPAEQKNHPPVAVKDQALLPAGGTSLVDVLANDTDPDNDVLVVQSVSADPRSGIKALLLDKRMLRIEAPTTDLAQPATLTYVVSDGRSQATGQVVVTPGEARQNTAPVANDNYETVRAGAVASVPVLANDSDPDGDRLSLFQSDLSYQSAKFPLFAAGNRYRLRAPEKAGTYTAIYGVQDPGGLKANATIHITVLPDTATDNRPPRPDPIVERTFNDKPVRVRLPLSGSDPDGDAVSITSLVDAPSLGRIVRMGLDYVIYQPFETSVGTDTFTVSVQDKYGATGIADVRVGVAKRYDVNQAPVALDDSFRVRPGRTITYDVVGNDLDPDGDALSVTTVSAAPGTKAADAGNGQISVRVAAPADGAQTSKQSVGYAVSDGLGASSSASLVVTGDAHAPLYAPVTRDDAADLSEISGKKAGDTVTVDVLSNDADPDGSSHDMVLSAIDAGSTVVDTDKLRIKLKAKDQVVAYEVTDGDDQTSYGFVFVSGTSTVPPVINPDKIPVKVKAGVLRELPLADLVLTRPGHQPQLTTADRVRAVNSDGSKLYKDQKTLVFRADKDFYGEAAVTFEVTDGVDLNDPNGLVSLLTIPIDVIPAKPVAPALRNISVEVPIKGDATAIDLTRLATDPNPGQRATLSYQVKDKGSAAATIAGTKLTIKPGARAKVGDTTVMTLEAKDVDGLVGTGTVNVRFVDTDALPLQIGAIEVKGKGGRTIKVDVSNYVTYNPFPGKGITVVSATVEAGKAEQPSVNGSTVSVTPDEGAGGVVSVRYTVEDDIGRQTVGRIRVVVADKPDAPSRPAVSGVESETLTLSWRAPADNGSPITDYVVTGNGATKPCGAVTTCRITGLTDGKTYSFTVVARNAEGDSPKSAASEPATPDKVPETMSAPKAEATKKDNQIEIAWSPPKAGGSAVQYYEISGSGGAGTRRAGPGSRSLLWSGLANGEDHSFTILAHNAKGDGSPSPSSAPAHAFGKPVANQPAPVGSTLDDGVAGRAVKVAWIEGATTANGDPITGWTVYMSSADGGGNKSARVGAGVRTKTFTAVNGKHYTFTVAATNAAGLGAKSASSSPVMPYGQASAPQDARKVVDKDHASTISFKPPADTGGLTITGYEVSSDGRTTTFSGTSGDVPFDSNNGPYTATIVPLAAGPDGTVRGKPAMVDDLRPYGQPGEPDGSASAAYKSVNFNASPGAENGRHVTGVQMNCDGTWDTRSSCTKNVNQGGDQACVSARTVGEDGTQSSERAICGNAEPRHVTVSFVSISPTGACSANCKRINVDVDGFAGGQYTVTVKQPHAPGEDYPSHAISVGSDGRGQVHDYWYTGYSQTVYATVDGVTGSNTP